MIDVVCVLHVQLSIRMHARMARSWRAAVSVTVSARL